MVTTVRPCALTSVSASRKTHLLYWVSVQQWIFVKVMPSSGRPREDRRKLSPLSIPSTVATSSKTPRRMHLMAPSDPNGRLIKRTTASIVKQRGTLLTWIAPTRLASPWRQGCASSRGALSSSPIPQRPCSKLGTWPEWQKLRQLRWQTGIAS